MSKIVKFAPDNTEQIRRKVSSVNCLWKMGELDNGEPCIIISMVNHSHGVPGHRKPKRHIIGYFALYVA